MTPLRPDYRPLGDALSKHLALMRAVVELGNARFDVDWRWGPSYPAARVEVVVRLPHGTFWTGSYPKPPEAK